MKNPDSAPLDANPDAPAKAAGQTPKPPRPGPARGRLPGARPGRQPRRAAAAGFRLGRLLAGGAALLAAASLTPARAQGDIPARPEQLTYAPLVYEPPAPEKFRVPLASGPVAYVVPDRELPLIQVVVYVRVGAYLEPAGREGLAGLAGYLLARGGTESQSAEALEERLAFLAARLESSIGPDQGSVSLNLLAKDADEGLALLREVLAAPRFQEDKIALRRQQLRQDMQQRNDQSAAIEEREKNFLAFGENFWANRLPTAASVDAITRADLVRFHRQWFHPANFVVAASGDFDRDQMTKKLTALFADWPFAGATPPPIPTNTVFAAPGVYLVNKDVNQGRAALLLPGIQRDNPDYFAVGVMNDILGGGGFTSRIMNRVRSDEGLAYDAHSRFPGGIYYPLVFEAGFQSKSRTVAYAASLVLDEMKRIAAAPVSAAELNVSRRGFIERFPRIFATKAQIASTLAQDEFTGRYARQPDFWKTYRARLEALGPDDVLRVARKYLTPEKLVLLIVGQKDPVLLGHPDHPVRLAELAGGRLTELPLRDPLTLQPLPLASNPPPAAP